MKLSRITLSGSVIKVITVKLLKPEHYYFPLLKSHLTINNYSKCFKVVPKWC